MSNEIDYLTSADIRSREILHWQGILLLTSGIVTLAAVWVIGLATGSFLVHVAYPFGFWLASDGLLLLTGGTALVRHPGVVVRMVGIGAGLGLILDFNMVYLTGILELTSVTTTGLALAMYLGWGLAMPAVYSSFRLARRVISWGRDETVEGVKVPAPLIPVLAIVGLPLAELALFSRLWVGSVPGWLIVPVFAGLWLLAEYVQVRRGRPSLLGSFLALDPRPLLAIVLAAIPFTLLWEGLSGLMGSWRYLNIFWLEPRILGIPLVAYFGYISGYYAIFLAVYGAVRTEEEGEVPLYGPDGK